MSPRAFAERAHRDQQYGEHPYVHHLAAVVAVLERFAVGDPDLLAAGWLHDVLEDTPTTRAELEAAFGARVAELVWAVTDEPGANRRERKAATLPKTRSVPGATQVKLADRIANAEASRGTSMQGMYRKELGAFEAALRVPGEHEPMWDHLRSVLGEERS